MTQSSLQDKINNLEKELVKIRRDLHMEPELSFQEFQTTEKLRMWLTDVGIRIMDLPLKTGLVAEIGTGSGPIVAIRADIDALPIEEKTGLPYASKIPGKMHACGHDFHSATILGAAYLIKAQENELSGIVRIIFQPAEETGHGAKTVLESGALEGVEAIFGLHNNPNLPLGAVGTRTGSLTAAVDRFEIIVKGVGTHAAMPEEGVDSIVTSAQIIASLQTIASRIIGAKDQVVLSVTRIQGGNTWNVLPETVELEGTVRTHDEKIRSIVPIKIKQIIEGVAASMGGSAELNWFPGPPATVNDKEWADFVKDTAKTVGHPVFDIEPQLGGEDFAFYLQKLPGAFLNIGTDKHFSLHHPCFDIDEKALTPGAKYFATLAKQALNKLKNIKR